MIYMVALYQLCYKYICICVLTTFYTILHKFHAENPQMIEAIVQNLSPRRAGSRDLYSPVLRRTVSGFTDEMRLNFSLICGLKIS